MQPPPPNPNPTPIPASPLTQLERLLTTRRRDLARALDLPPADPLLTQPAAALSAAELGQLRPRSEAVLARLKAEEAARLKTSQTAHSAAQTAKVGRGEAAGVCIHDT